MNTKPSNTVFGAIVRELHSKYKTHIQNKRQESFQNEFESVLADEIRDEIDKELIADLIKAAKVPKDML